jgi:hypothetical protein
MQQFAGTSPANTADRENWAARQKSCSAKLNNIEFDEGHAMAWPYWTNIINVGSRHGVTLLLSLASFAYKTLQK